MNFKYFSKIFSAFEIFKRKLKKNINPIFIVGVPRSGTTLLASILSTHSNIIIPNETEFIFHLRTVLEKNNNVENVIKWFTHYKRWMDFNIPEELLKKKLEKHYNLNIYNVLDDFYNCFVELSGKKRWGDKTPTYSKLLKSISRNWPYAYVIHIIRDGRAVANSFLKLNWGPNNIKKAAELWKKNILKCRKDSKYIKYYYEIRFENLLSDFDNEIRDICNFINESFEEDMLLFYKKNGVNRYNEMIKNKNINMNTRKEYHKNIIKPIDKNIAEKWKSELSMNQIKKFQDVAGDLLTELNYSRL